MKQGRKNCDQESTKQHSQTDARVSPPRFVFVVVVVVVVVVVE
jgi:hypothetical protein